MIYLILLTIIKLTFSMDTYAGTPSWMDKFCDISKAETLWTDDALKVEREEYVQANLKTLKGEVLKGFSFNGINNISFCKVGQAIISLNDVTSSIRYFTYGDFGGSTSVGPTRMVRLFLGKGHPYKEKSDAASLCKAYAGKVYTARNKDMAIKICYYEKSQSAIELKTLAGGSSKYPLLRDKLMNVYFYDMFMPTTEHYQR